MASSSLTRRGVSFTGRMTILVAGMWVGGWNMMEIGIIEPA